MSAGAIGHDEAIDLPEPTPGDQGPSSYGAIVWQQLSQDRVAVFGLWCIALFALSAVYAPLISLDQPLLWFAPDGPLSPWFASLFNRLFFENAVDIFFNLALVLSPLYFVGVLLARRAGVSLGRAILWLSIIQALGFCALAPERWGPVENPLYYTERTLPWLELAEAEDAPAHVFPLRPHNYRATDPSRSVAAPSLEHWLGTDSEGRDVFARMLYGTRVSITIGVVAVSIYVGIGVVLGALAGYFGRWVDMVVSRMVEVMICFPSFFLILTLAAFIENRSIFHVMVIIGVTSWPGVARLIRAEFLRHKELEYAEAALALGVPRRRIIFRHILPNAIAPVLVTATFGVASAVLTESGLAFLGLGDISVPSWGGILSSGRAEQKIWLILAPGFAIFALVSVFNLVGEGLRDALDPKLRR